MQWTKNSYQNFTASIVGLSLFNVGISKFSANETLGVVNSEYATALQAVVSTFFSNFYSCLFSLDICVIVLCFSAMCKHIGMCVLLSL